MDFLPAEIEKYTLEHTFAESELLNKLNRETYARVLMPRMLSGHLQGRVLAMFSHMIKPTNILEIGTYTGYSALCLAEGLKEKGTLHTIDINEELEDMVRKYFKESGKESQIKYHIGDATKIISTLNETFDIVFIDADKENYSTYFDLVIDKVRHGGFIIADNVLWSGKVASENIKIDKDTASLKSFNNKVHKDERVENVLLPIRDGLMILRKI